MKWHLLLAATGWLALTGSAWADDFNVAVAANFTAPAREIAALFEQKTGHKPVLSFAATGQLYAQIKQAAPFAVFLSADARTPEIAVAEGLAVADSRFTYAFGRLALWGRDPANPASPETLRTGTFHKLAIANPALAPYGLAAIQTLEKLQLKAAVEGRLVQGSTIAQALQFVDTGNAELGFVALSQVISNQQGSRWVVPADLHEPIRQDAVLLTSATGNQPARDFLAFLKGPEARDVILRYGYGQAD